MTERDLDRLVTRTVMSPLCRQTLRYVRAAVILGVVGAPIVTRTAWSVSVDRPNGQAATFTFPLKES